MKATVVVQFGQGADSNALVVVELDGEMNRTADDEEKTQFFPGDRPVCWCTTTPLSRSAAWRAVRAWSSRWAR